MANQMYVDYAREIAPIRRRPPNRYEWCKTLTPRTSRILSSILRAVAIGCLTIASAAAGEVRISDDFRDVLTAVEQSAAAVGPEHVLLVVDIDNTILKMNRDLGSEQWFDWQEYLLKNEPESKQLVANSFDGLLIVQGILFDRGSMHPPQSDLPAIVRSIQDRGVATVVLTSRGEEYRASTERELHRNGFDFATHMLSVRDAKSDTYLPYDSSNPMHSGLTDADFTTAGSPEPRPVSYSKGIMMTSGQHKGLMLATLLHRSTRKIKVVVYADNRADHVAALYALMLSKGVDATAIVYQREANNIRAFQYGSKQEVVCGWLRICQQMKAANNLHGKKRFRIGTSQPVLLEK
jgi:hypothetical protein